jgi:hypothetical protein
MAVDLTDLDLGIEFRVLHRHAAERDVLAEDW